MRHIRACNAYRPERFVPLLAGEARIGRIRRDNAEALARFPQAFAVTSDAVRVVAKGDPATLSADFDRVIDALLNEGRVAKWRQETFAVARRWGEAPLFSLDRGAVSFFGVRAYGVHLNGYRRTGGGITLWIGRRNPDKRVAPGKLDNLVAGGIGGGLGVWETLVKESEEEASLPRALVDRAHAVGAVSYKMEVEHGLRDDVLFLYDLETPGDFVPRNNDCEFIEFLPMDSRTVLAGVRNTEDYKFNVNLTLIDFALRHGLIGPDDPEYLELLTGLHRGDD